MLVVFVRKLSVNRPENTDALADKLERQINARFTELDPNQQYHLHCKASVHTLKALNFLRQQGFKYLKSVKGGITARSEEIDSKVPRY